MTPRSLVRGGSGMLLIVGTFHQTPECGILYKSSVEILHFFKNLNVFLFLLELKGMAV
jgi:hypothetical protein